MLEIERPESPKIADACRKPVDGRCRPQFAETPFHDFHGLRTNVDSDPLALHPLRHGDGSAATAERIENNLTRTTARTDDALKESLGLLRRIAEAFGGCR